MLSLLAPKIIEMQLYNRLEANVISQLKMGRAKVCLGHGAVNFVAGACYSNERGNLPSSRHVHCDQSAHPWRSLELSHRVDRMNVFTEWLFKMVTQRKGDLTSLSHGTKAQSMCAPNVYIDLFSSDCGERFWCRV